MTDSYRFFPELGCKGILGQEAYTKHMHAYRAYVTAELKDQGGVEAVDQFMFIAQNSERLIHLHPSGLVMSMVMPGSIWRQCEHQFGLVLQVVDRTFPPLTDLEATLTKIKATVCDSIIRMERDGAVNILTQDLLEQLGLHTLEHVGECLDASRRLYGAASQTILGSIHDADKDDPIHIMGCLLDQTITNHVGMSTRWMLAQMGRQIEAQPDAAPLEMANADSVLPRLHELVSARSCVQEDKLLPATYALIGSMMQMAFNAPSSAINFFNNVGHLALVVGEMNKARQAMMIATQIVRKTNGAEIPQQLRRLHALIEVMDPTATC